jgi:hypothetical protein
MRPFDDDFDDLDEFEFDSFAATRRLIGEKQRRHHKTGGRRRHVPSRNDRWNSDVWDDYDELEFDKYSGLDFDSH